jgi:hypothetical protein
MLTISFAANFDLDSSSSTFGKIVLTDTSNYVANGINVVNTSGYFVINSPVGIYYTGNTTTPDITAGSTFTIPIPTDANNNYLQGTYNIQYFVVVTGSILAGSYSSALLPYNFFPTSLTGSISDSYDCVCLNIIAKDTTVYGNPTTLTRTFTLIPPQGLNPQPSNYVTNAPILSYVFQYTGTYTLTLSTLVTYVNGAYTTTELITARQELAVVCNINFCTLIACYNDFFATVLQDTQNFTNINKIPASLYNKYLIILGAYAGFKENFLCNNPQQTQYYYNILAQYLNCDCGCSHTTVPTLINPFCGSTAGNSNITVVQGGTGINVTSSTVGNTTTYTVAINATTWTNINNLLTQVAANTSAIAALQALTQGAIILSNNLTPASTGANTTLTTLMSYALVANTVTNGSQIRVEAQVNFANNTNSKTVELSLGSGILFTQTIANTFFGSNKIFIVAEINKINNTSYFYTISYALNSSPAVYKIYEGTVTGFDFTTNQTIALSGQNGIATANDITANQLLVEQINIV